MILKLPGRIGLRRAVFLWGEISQFFALRPGDACCPGTKILICGRSAPPISACRGGIIDFSKINPAASETTGRSHEFCQNKPQQRLRAFRWGTVGLAKRFI